MNDDSPRNPCKVISSRVETPSPEPNQSPDYLREKKRLSWLRDQALHKKLLIAFIRKAGGDISESRTAIESALIWISSMRATTVGGTFITTKSKNGETVIMGSGVLSTQRKRFILTCVGLLEAGAQGGRVVKKRYITVQIVDSKSRTSPTCWESNTWF